MIYKKSPQCFAIRNLSTTITSFKQIKNLEKKAHGLDKTAIKLLADANIIRENLEKSVPARDLDIDSKPFNLLTSKPVIYVCNVEESAAATGNKYSQMVIDKFSSKSPVLIISGKIEMEIAQIVLGRFGFKTFRVRAGDKNRI